MQKMLVWFVFLAALCASVFLASKQALAAEEGSYQGMDKAGVADSLDGKKDENVVEIAIGGFLTGSRWIRIDKNRGKIYLLDTKPGRLATFEKYKDLPPGKTELGEGITLSIEAVSSGELAYILAKFQAITAEWEEQYINMDIMDGIQWRVSRYLNGTEHNIFGSNRYPANWDEFKDFMAEILQEKRSSI